MMAVLAFIVGFLRETVGRGWWSLVWTLIGAAFLIACAG